MNAAWLRIPSFCAPAGRLHGLDTRDIGWTPPGPRLGRHWIPWVQRPPGSRPVGSSVGEAFIAARGSVDAARFELGGGHSWEVVGCPQVEDQVEPLAAVQRGNPIFGVSQIHVRILWRTVPPVTEVWFASGHDPRRLAVVELTSA